MTDIAILQDMNRVAKHFAKSKHLGPHVALRQELRKLSQQLNFQIQFAAHDKLMKTRQQGITVNNKFSKRRARLTDKFMGIDAGLCLLERACEISLAAKAQNRRR